MALTLCLVAAFYTDREASYQSLLPQGLQIVLSMNIVVKNVNVSWPYRQDPAPVVEPSILSGLSPTGFHFPLQPLAKRLRDACSCLKR